MNTKTQSKSFVYKLRVAHPWLLLLAVWLSAVGPALANSPAKLFFVAKDDPARSSLASNITTAVLNGSDTRHWMVYSDSSGTGQFEPVLDLSTKPLAYDSREARLAAWGPALLKLDTWGKQAGNPASTFPIMALLRALPVMNLPAPADMFIVGPPIEAATVGTPWSMVECRVPTLGHLFAGIDQTPYSLQGIPECLSNMRVGFVPSAPLSNPHHHTMVSSYWAEAIKKLGGSPLAMSSVLANCFGMSPAPFVPSGMDLGPTNLIGMINAINPVPANPPTIAVGVKWWPGSEADARATVLQADGTKVVIDGTNAVTVAGKYLPLATDGDGRITRWIELNVPPTVVLTNFISRVTLEWRLVKGDKCFPVLQVPGRARTPVCIFFTMPMSATWQPIWMAPSVLDGVMY